MMTYPISCADCGQLTLHNDRGYDADICNDCAIEREEAEQSEDENID